MLAQSLALHDTAASALNEIISLNMASLEGVMALLEGSSEGQSAEVQASLKEKINEILGCTKSVRSQIAKAGAKISATRLQSLRDIAEKLSVLIESVSGEAAKKDKKKSHTLNDIGNLISDLTGLKEALASLKDDSVSKFDTFSKKFEELENAAGASNAIEDDEDNESNSESSHHQNEKSVFTGLFPIEDIKKRAKKTEVFLNGKK